VKFFTKTLLILVVGLFSTVYSANAQSASADFLDLNAGISGTDGINIGARDHFNQSQIGFNLGTAPDFNGRFRRVMLSAAFYGHLWGKSRYSLQRPWYIKPGLTYHHIRYRGPVFYAHATNQGIIRLHLGREFYFAEDFGLSFSAGPNGVFYYHSQDPNARDFRMIAFPDYISISADALIFYRLSANK
jgi:hypothetical protein